MLYDLTITELRKDGTQCGVELFSGITLADAINKANQELSKFDKYNESCLFWVDGKCGAVSSNYVNPYGYGTAFFEITPKS